MSDNDNETPTSWRGWQRLPGQRKWRAVVSGATEGQCHERLLDHPFPGQTRDLCVLPGDRDPNTEDRPR